MELRYLTTFVAVAETGSMTAASMRCNITQAAVSQQIKSLEDEFGIKLLQRDKDLKLTDAGKALYEKAKKMTSIAYEIKEELAEMRGQICGDLHIGAGAFIEPFIGPAIARFIEQYPRVRVHCHYDYAHNLNRMLRNGELDIAFSVNESYLSEGIITRPCFKYNLYAIMHKDHELAGKDSVTSEDLLGCRLIMPDTGDREMATVQRYAGFDISTLLPATICESNNANSILNGVIVLNAVTFMPKEYVMRRPELVAKPIEGFDQELCSNVHHMEGKLKESARKFIEMTINNK